MLSNQIPKLGSTQAFGGGFESPLHEGFFDGVAKKIIEELVIDIPTLESIRNDARAYPADSQWACIRSRAVLHRLCSLQVISGQTSSQEWKAHCVITALAMLIGYENLCVSLFRYSKSVRSRLVDGLISSNSDFSPQGNWGRHNNMLLWIMVTGVRIAYRSDDEGWFMTRALQDCRMLGLESYDQLYALVRNFLSVENCQCPALVKLAEHIAIANAESLERPPSPTHPATIEYPI
jgi:hypothetical protein